MSVFAPLRISAFASGVKLGSQKLGSAGLSLPLLLEVLAATAGLSMAPPVSSSFRFLEECPSLVKLSWVRANASILRCFSSSAASCSSSWERMKCLDPLSPRLEPPSETKSHRKLLLLRLEEPLLPINLLCLGQNLNGSDATKTRTKSQHHRLQVFQRASSSCPRKEKPDSPNPRFPKYTLCS